MLFIDASAYLSLLNPDDNNHQHALNFIKKITQKKFITSQAVLGEILTVGSMRFNKQKTIKFVEKILNSKTLVVLETSTLTVLAFQIFKEVRSKNISWVDCYSQAIINAYSINSVFTFDKDFAKLKKLSSTLN